MLEAVLDLTVFCEHGLEVLVVGVSLGDLHLKLLGALPHRADLDGSVHDLVDDGLVGSELGLLL